MIITESERLLIRLPTLDDTEAAFAVYSDPEVMRFIDGDQPIKTLDEAKKIIERGLTYYNKNNICHWAVEEKASGHMIGFAGFNFFEDTQDYELVIHLNRSYWDKGYATEVGQAVVAYAIQKLNAIRIVALTTPENNASKKIIENIGLSFVAEMILDGYLLHYYELTTPGGS